MAQHRILRALAPHNLHIFQPGFLEMESHHAFPFHFVVHRMRVRLLAPGFGSVSCPPTPVGLGREADVLSHATF